VIAAGVLIAVPPRPAVAATVTLSFAGVGSVIPEPKVTVIAEAVETGIATPNVKVRVYEVDTPIVVTVGVKLAPVNAEVGATIAAAIIATTAITPKILNNLLFIDFLKSS
jgi:hypothetical protein